MRHVFNSITLAVIVYDNKAESYIINSYAKHLLAIDNNSNIITKSALSDITLLDSKTNTFIAITQLFLADHSSSILLKHHDQTTLLNVTRTVFCDDCVMLTLEHSNIGSSEEYNFDKIISEISAELIDIQNDNIDQQIDFALKAIGTVCKADRSYLFEFNTNNQTLTNTHEWVNTGVTSYKNRLQNIPKSELPYFFDAMNLTHVFQVNDITQLPAEAQSEKTEFEIQSIKSVLCIGLRFDKELVGFIGCDCVKQQRQWSDIDLIRIKLVGEIINNALKNIKYKQKLHDAQQQLINANTKLCQLANTDGLTNIANRRYFDNVLKSELKRCARQKKPISLIMCDIDFFKHYNDFYGHQKGDDVLKTVAKALKKLCKREGDLAARYGGEEFALILPLIDAEHCREFARLVQQKIASLNIVHEYSPIASSLTLSFGCYSCIPNATTQAEEIINNADKALYQAKNANRNQINVYNT